MQVLFDGDVHVHYGQVYVESGGQNPEDPLTSAFAGQVNGLCGAAWQSPSQIERTDKAGGRTSPHKPG